MILDEIIGSYELDLRLCDSSVYIERWEMGGCLKI